MFAARAITTIARRNMSAFTGSVISGAPRNRVPFAEKMFLAGLMTTSFLVGPIWVLVHLQDYKA